MSLILRVNTRTKEAVYQQCPEQYQHIGGRALISEIMNKEVDPTCDALGPQNKLVIAPGPLAGTTVSCVNRISIGGKSPLTGTIKESNGGGINGYKLGRLAIKAVILEDVPEDKETNVLYVSSQRTEILSFPSLKDFGVYQATEILKEQFGHKVGIIVIGPSGERLYRNSGIANIDKDGVPSRYSARGGLGALMGSKGIKAIVLDDTGSKEVEIKDKDLFKKTRDTITASILNNDKTANSYTKYGTAALVDVINGLGALPTRNFSTGSFEGADKISGETLYKLIQQRKGKGSHSHACMPGCLIKCSNIFPDEEGKVIVSPIEYETIGLMGSNCGIDNLDCIARLNYICNDIGLDTIEMGGTIGVAMEAGVIAFGDGEGAIGLLEEIRKDSYLGKILASGTEIAGKVLGVKRIPTVKGQTLAAYDPRTIKGLGVTYATSTMGADHTAGQTLREKVVHTKPDYQVEVSRRAQIKNTLFDSLGVCMFMNSGLNGEVSLWADLLTSMTGKNYTVSDLENMAKEALRAEKQFNDKAGITSAQDRLPEFFYKEVNPITDTVFDVRDEEMQELYKF